MNLTNIQAGDAQLAYEAGATSANDIPRPLITVVTVVFNGAKTLRATIKSIASQLSEEVEYVIIDGGSTDNTVNIIREFECVLSYWVSEPDRGIYEAWNKAINVSRGTFISFIGADDTLEPRALQTYIDHIKAMPNIDYWSSQIALGDANGRIVGRPWRWKNFRRYMTVAHVGSLHRRELYVRNGNYDTSFKVAGDYEFLLRLGNTLQAGFFESVTVVMGIEGISNSQISNTLKETLRAKILTRARSRIFAYFDYYLAVAKQIYPR